MESQSESATVVQRGDLLKDDNKLIQQDIDINDLVFDPYNVVNKYISEKEVNDIFLKYGIPHKVNNMTFFKRAFIHRSYCKRPHLENVANGITLVERPKNCLPLSTKSNERLEFLGDGILEAITKYYLYRRFPKENEGFMTDKKIALVKNENIGLIAYEMGLHNHFVISKHAEEKKLRTNLKKLGCLFEAFVGALFLDVNKKVIKDEDGWFDDLFVCGPGFQMTQKFVENVFEKHVDWMKLIGEDDNYKNILQVIIQKTFKTTPTYIEKKTNATSEDNDYYTMGVFIYLMDSDDKHPSSLVWDDYNEWMRNNKSPNVSETYLKDLKELYEKTGKLFVLIGEGTHKIKKKAEQIASKLAIDKFKDYKDMIVE